MILRYYLISLSCQNTSMYMSKCKFTNLPIHNATHTQGYFLSIESSQDKGNAPSIASLTSINKPFRQLHTPHLCHLSTQSNWVCWKCGLLHVVWALQTKSNATIPIIEFVIDNSCRVVLLSLYYRKLMGKKLKKVITCNIMIMWSSK